MTNLTKKLNRAELLQLAIDGKVKAGDKFKDERGDEVTFTGSEFTWRDGMSLKLMVHGREHFTPVFVDTEIMVRLKQSEINDLAILLGESHYGSLSLKANRRGITIPSATGHTALYRKISDMQK